MSKSRETIERLRDALIWCSGSADFGDGGKAREGWLKTCVPVLEESRVELLNGTYNDSDGGN